MQIPGPRRAGELVRRLRRRTASDASRTLPLADDAWLVQRPGRPRGRLDVDQLARGVWVVQRRGRRRSVLRIGSASAGTHLIVDERRAQRAVAHQQTQLAHHVSNEHLAAVLRRLGINCLLDVGANGGQFGSRVRAAGYQGRIVSFEPLPHVAARIRPLAGADPDWQVVETALGNETTEAEMTVVAARGATSSLLPASDYGLDRSPRLAGVRREQVTVRRLEDLIDEVTDGIPEPRVFLKMDTQGYDVRVFEGAGDRIKDVLGIQSEVSCLSIYDGMPRFLEAIATYEAAGFETTGMFPVTTEGDTLRVVEFDVVMVRADAMSADA